MRRISAEGAKLIFGIDMIAAMSARFYVLASICRVGDPQVWQRVIDAVDRRYRRCVPTGSRLEKDVARHFSSGSQPALATGRLDAGSLAFQKWQAINARRSGVPFNCSDALSRPAIRYTLDPSLATPGEIKAERDAEKDELRAHPDNFWTFSMFEVVRGLGEDRAWIDEPCGEFFPKRDRK